MQDRRVYAFNPLGEALGYARLGNDEVGDPDAEVYDNAANKLGTARLYLDTTTEEQSEIFNPEGRQIGLARLQHYGDGKLGADVYWMEDMNTQSEVRARLHISAGENGAMEVRQKENWGMLIGTLQPENASKEELILAGAAAALLMMV